MTSITRNSLSKSTHEAPSSSSGLSRNYAADTWFIVVIGLLSIAVVAIAISLVVPPPDPISVEYLGGPFP